MNAGHQADHASFSLSRRFQKLFDRAADAGTPPWSLALKVGASSVRRRIPGMTTVVVTLDRHGTRVLADLTTPLGLALYRYGFSPPEARLVQTMLQPGDVFLDGGAHIGLFSLLAAAVVGQSGRVIACEPVPETVRLLGANIALNQFDWVEVHTAAIADEAGEQEIFSFGAGSGLSSFAPATRVGTERLLVDVVSLDELSAACRGRVRLVKLDIEGAEVKALTGAKLLLQEKPDFLVEVESDHLARQGTGVREMQEIFSASGYRGYDIRASGSDVVLVPTQEWGAARSNANMFVSPRPLAELRRSAVVTG